MTLGNRDATNCEYSLRIVGPAPCEGFWRMVDDTDDAVEFMGNWDQSESDPRYYMNRERTTDIIGNSARFTFHGTKARAYGTLDRKNGGAFDVYIDNVYVESIVLRWGDAMGKVYQTGFLPDGKHTLEFRVKEFQGSRNASIDAFSFESLANRISPREENEFEPDSL